MKTLIYEITVNDLDESLSRLLGNDAAVGRNTLLKVQVPCGFTRDCSSTGAAYQKDDGKIESSAFIFDINFLGDRLDGFDRDTYIITRNGTLFKRSGHEPLTDEVNLIDQYRKSRIFGKEVEGEIQRILDTKYKKVEPLSPLDPRMPTYDYDLERDNFTTDPYGGESLPVEQLENFPRSEHRLKRLDEYQSLVKRIGLSLN